MVRLPASKQPSRDYLQLTLPELRRFSWNRLLRAMPLPLLPPFSPLPAPQSVFISTNLFHTRLVLSEDKVPVLLGARLAVLSEAPDSAEDRDTGER